MPPPEHRRDPAVDLVLDTRDEGEWTVLEVGGEVDLSTASALRTRIDALIDGGTRRLVVSLSDVGFVDSSGLAALIAARKGMQEAGGQLVISCERASVLKLFTVTGLDRILSIHGSVAEAIAS